MALVRLASGEMFPEEQLPVRNGQPYDPTAQSGGGIYGGTQSPIVTAFAQDQAETGPNAKSRFWVKDPKTGKINTGLNDGTDPRQFDNVEQMNAYMRQAGETDAMEFDTPEEAIATVRKYTGNPDYNGYYEGYQPPAPQPGSPAAQGQNFRDWNALQNDGKGANQKGTPAGGTPNTTGSGGITSTGGPAANGGFGPNYTDVGYFGNQNKTGMQVNTGGSLSDILKQFLQESQNISAQGKEALTGITSDYKDQLAFQRAGAEQTYGRQNYLTNLLLGLGKDGQIGANGYTPGSLGAGISSAIGTMNDATGLSPEAMAALRLQATEGPESAYQGQVSQLKTQLQGRGAYGGGDTPGSLGDIVGGYAPLMQNRDSTRSQLLSNAILANEQRKFDTLGLNRQTAANAMSTAAGLTTGLGNVFNPSTWLNTGQSSLAGLSGIASQIPAIGFQGLNTAGDFAKTLSDTQGTSLASLLKAALAGSVGNTVSNIDWGKLATAIGGAVGGGQSSGPSGGGSIYD